MTKSPSAAIVPVTARPVKHKGTRKRVHHIPPRPIDPEVITEDELRQGEQLKSKADVPDAVFEAAMNGDDVVMPGVTVHSETLLGFLAAMEKVTKIGATKGVPQAALMSFETGDEPRIVLECANPRMWAIVGIKAASPNPDGFVAMLPVKRSKAVLKAIRAKYPSVTVGLAEEGVCLGTHVVPYAGKPQDFPTRPEIRNYKARIAFPAAYLEAVCKRIMPVRSRDMDDPGMSSVLLDFHQLKSGPRRLLCVAIATDGSRMHLLKLPRAVVEPKTQRGKLEMPPPVLVPHEFFQYLRAVVDREWTAVEVSGKQITARGDDYLVIADALVAGHSTVRSALNWRKVDVDYAGYWTVDKVKLMGVLTDAIGVSTKLRLRVDALRNELEIRTRENGARYLKRLQVKNFDGPDLVEVRVDGRFLIDALKSCASGLIRLGFAPTIETQSSAPIVVRDDDEHFKAIIMPMT